MLPKFLDFEYTKDEQMGIIARGWNSDDEDIKKIHERARQIFSNLTPYQKLQIARHPDRPYTLDYVKLLCGNEFFELHGDRLYGDDKAIIGGLGVIGGNRVMIIGHQKGRDANSSSERNFGMAHPEGYRKAIRLMHMAEHFGIPIITFIDTPGAAPDDKAEERGQSNAISECLAEMSELRVPVMCFVIGEGGSGGALALGVGNRIYMFEHSVYSVISAEGCAAILWKDSEKTSEAARQLKICASDLLKAGFIDGIIEEPVGGAHRDYVAAAESIKACILKDLSLLKNISADELIEQRYIKFRSFGLFKS